MDKPSDKPATLYYENEPVVKKSTFDALQIKLDEAQRLIELAPKHLIEPFSRTYSEEWAEAYFKWKGLK